MKLLDGGAREREGVSTSLRLTRGCAERKKRMTFAAGYYRKNLSRDFLRGLLNLGLHKIYSLTLNLNCK
jgi:hypothetical protein